MTIEEVVLLEEAAEDMNDGISFYAEKEEWWAIIFLTPSFPTLND